MQRRRNLVKQGMFDFPERVDSEVSLGELEQKLSRFRLSGVAAVPEAFRINQRILSTWDYDILRTVYYGTQNLDIPDEVLLAQNGGETLGLYFGAAVLKRNNWHLRGDGVPRDPFSLVRYMKGVIRNTMRFKEQVKQIKWTYDGAFSNQEHRMGLVSRDARDALIESFFSEYRPSKATNREHPNSFYDRNCDGANPALYAQDIYWPLQRKSVELAGKLRDSRPVA